MIAIIRNSDDVAQAREKLMTVFELTEVQANDILDIPLRRLTKFSVLELEKERNELHATIAALTEIVEKHEVLSRLVSDELAEVARTYGDPRRTVLLASSGEVPQAAAPLEIPDSPAWVMLSSTGLLARMDTDADIAVGGRRAQHDVITSAIKVSTRAEFGVVTNHGRLIRARAIELPTVVQTNDSPNLKGGSRARELYPLGKGEKPLALTTLRPDSPGLALGTRNGVVKRVRPEVLGKDSWEVIGLDAGDELVGALELATEDCELVFLTSEASLLHFNAGLVRPQGRLGGGVAGVKLPAGARAIWFGASPVDDAVVVTISGSADAAPGTETGSVKVTPFTEYPAKGRATGGVRCHRFLKGEDALVLGWVGPTPAIAAASSGSAIELPPATGRRDGSGTPALQPIAAIGTRELGWGRTPGAVPGQQDPQAPVADAGHEDPVPELPSNADEDPDGDTLV